MIKIKPIIYNISAFDALLEHTITFIYNGNQPFSNTCIIRNNTTNIVVYQNTQETLQLKHIIPSNALANGALYNISLYITDQSGIVSEMSDAVLFYCYSTPSFTIDNLIPNQVVRNSSYEITLTYNQPEGESLQYFQVLLYNTNKNQIWTSGVKYNTNTLSAKLSSLEDNAVYYVRATGLTINGMELDTGYIYFSVNYVQPNVYALIALENLKNEGSVKIQSNIIALSAKCNGGAPKYISNDYIDLSSGSYLYFDEGFSLNDNFTINIKGYGFNLFSTILEMTNGNDTIKLLMGRGVYESENNGQRIYFELNVPSAFSYYTIRSNYITVFADVVSIWIRRKNNVYDVYAEVLSTNNVVDGGSPTSTDYYIIDGGFPMSKDTLMVDGGNISI
ncbi:hypothetical protein [Anaerocolumna xylanovorans]|uniref:Uncharacterized protein n=1 Tax=Anaerocolumna xylanovorans DSM 12503 TaxID=1121345 RepID=A0A1M7YM63_9FIRM|nr:hypothetical protein [Anaerocolumna xylanovorans]SHO53699.1 hypothetical protein SAMN02745217_04244 [Anaerocolumna xylanovorans DSM 12503]